MRFLLTLFIILLGFRSYEEIPALIKIKQENKELKQQNENYYDILSDLIYPAPVGSVAHCIKDGYDFLGVVSVSANTEGGLLVWIAVYYATNEDVAPKSGLVICKARDTEYITNEHDGEKYQKMQEKSYKLDVVRIL